MKFSGVTSCFEHKWDSNAKVPEGTPKGIRKVWLLDAQWSTCPKEVEDQVKDLWSVYKLGNDNYIIKMNMEELIHMNDYPENYYLDVVRFVDGEWKKFDAKVDAILFYAREMGVKDDEMIIIHWWW